MRVLRQIRPSPEQLVILGDAGAGFRLIRGAAGSGKTTTALMRLRQLCSSRISRKARLGLSEPVRVLVLTFNRTLRGYVKQLAAEQVSASEDIHLTVETFSRWALSLCGPRDVMDQSLIRKLLIDAGFAGHLDYFIDEVQYILGRFQPDGRNRYLQVIRTGRGRAPAVVRQTRARLLADVIAPYEREKDRLGVVDWNDIALEAASVTGQGYDVVVVDETQDLSANQIRTVIAHLKPDHTTTFVMDAMQRIYPQAFLWREIGLEIRPQMVFMLKVNHRNTVEIARFAASIIRGLPDEEDGVLPNPQACRRHGDRPEIVVGKYNAQLNYMLDRIQPFLATGDTVAVLQVRGGGWFNFARTTLRRKRLQFCELTRERDWPTGPEQVVLSTIHSAKGLEFDHVLLPGLNQEVTPHGEEEGDGTLDSLRRLLAMGIGRARKTVSVGYKSGEQSTLIGLFDPTTYERVELG